MNFIINIPILFYNANNPSSFPDILDPNLDLIMHPELTAGSSLLELLPHAFLPALVLILFILR
jgi:hypothetical protein